MAPSPKVSPPPPRKRPRKDVKAVPPTRPYLRAEDRRRQLLEVAATIAGSEGVERLTIVGLARAAGVSRQLVYDHFSDLSGLVLALLVDRFTAIDQAIEEAIQRPAEQGATPDPLRPALETARRFFALPREDRHMLRSVLAATDAPAHELNGLALQLRERSIERWDAVLGGADRVRSRARMWALVSAANGLGDMVSTGELTAEEAQEEIEHLLRSAFDLPAPEPSRRRRRAAAP